MVGILILNETCEINSIISSIFVVTAGILIAIKDIKNFIHKDTIILSVLNGIHSEAEIAKEYGVDTIQIHADALNEDDVVLLHDDLLATGGSMAAALELVRKFNVKKVYINFIIELDFLNGRKAIGDNVEISSLLSC